MARHGVGASIDGLLRVDPGAAPDGSSIRAVIDRLGLPADYVRALSAAAASADWSHATDFSLVITNAPGDASWPISATVFVLMHAQPKDAERAKAAREFFSWGYEHGKTQAASLDYVPLPESLVTQIKAYWADRIK